MGNLAQVLPGLQSRLDLMSDDDKDDDEDDDEEARWRKKDEV